MGSARGVGGLRRDGVVLLRGGLPVLWDALEAVALLLIVLGGFLLFGAWALIVGGALIVALSFVVNRKAGDGS